MDLIRKLALGIGALFSAIIVKLLTDEIKAQIPWLTGQIVHVAAMRLPTVLRDRFAEKWQQVVDETPGDIRKLFVAFGFVMATRHMRKLVTVKSARTFRNGLQYAFAMLALLALAMNPLQLDAPLVDQSRLLWMSDQSMLAMTYFSYAIDTALAEHGISDAKRHADGPVGSLLAPALEMPGNGKRFLVAPSVVKMLNSTGMGSDASGTTFNGIGDL